MPAMPVSVVIPTRDRVHMLARALQSALSQTVKPSEVIVVDDGSSPEVGQAIDALCDGRASVIHHERSRGPAAARNTGIRAARGEFIAFLDDDDEWMPAKLARQLPLLEEGCVAVVCGYANRSGRAARVHRGRSLYPDVLRRGNRFPPSGLIAMRSVLAETLFDASLPGSVGEDWDLLIRLTAIGRVGHVPDTLFVYEDRSWAPRVTTQHASLSIDQIDRRMEVLRKNRSFLGEFWFKYHVACFLLAFIARRPGKLKLLTHALRRCGWTAVTAVMWHKITSR